MCGIFCVVSGGNESQAALNESFQSFQRGIANRGPDTRPLEQKFITFQGKSLLLTASVLWLQGRTITRQPVEDNGCTLVYNGDVFGGANSDEERIVNGDTLLFLKSLQQSNSVCDTLEGIHGPYAFIYFNENEGKLYFGRDKFGRRSLIIGKNDDKLIITSVAPCGLKCIEVPAIGVFCLDLKNDQLSLFPWKSQNKNFNSKLENLNEFLNESAVIHTGMQLPFIEHRLFQHPTDEDLKLYNNIKNFQCLLENDEWNARVDRLQELLETAIKKRIRAQPAYCQICLKNRNNLCNPRCNHATTGVLFSGGVDCTILALLTSKFIDKHRPIDLLNVAFENKNLYETPDRKTGLESLEELKKLDSERKWNFRRVNVPLEELSQKTEVVKDLIHPLETVMDFDLGRALWFAARGELSDPSPTRVLVVGMGADELFGGYRRHAKEFKVGGWSKLNDVLNEDWENLPHRNLGRDDRVVSDHGRQLRTPYLDEELVSFVRNLPTWQKTWPNVKDGFGEKILLRSLAYKLGLHKAAELPKRALQFGSRIANPKNKGHQNFE